MAIAVAATVGGTPVGVGRLGQLFEGPGIPPAAELPKTATPSPGRSTPGLSFSPLPAVPVTSVAARSLLPATPSTTKTTGTHRRHSVSRTRVVEIQEPRQHVNVPPPSPAPSPAPEPGTVPQKTLLRRVGDQVTGIVRKVPAVGTPVADAVDTVIDLLSPPPPAGAHRMRPRIALPMPAPVAPATNPVVQTVSTVVDAVTQQPAK
jgi:hypothetical protein